MEIRNILEEEDKMIRKLKGELCSATSAAGVPLLVGNRYTPHQIQSAVSSLRNRGWEISQFEKGELLTLKVLREGKD